MIEVGDLVRVKPNSFVQIDDMAVVSNALPVRKNCCVMKSVLALTALPAPALFEKNF